MLGKSLMPTWRISCLNRSLISLIYDTLEGHLQTHVYYFIRSVSKKCAQDRQIFLGWFFLKKIVVGDTLCTRRCSSGFELEMKICYFCYGGTKQNTQNPPTHNMFCHAGLAGVFSYAAVVLYPNDALSHTHWRASITLRKTPRYHAIYRRTIWLRYP